MARKKTKKSDYIALSYGVRPAPRIPSHITVAQGINSERWADEGIWVPVISSNVSTIRFSKKRSELFVSYGGGRTYRYSNVPESVAQLMFNASSQGIFVHRVLKPNYPAVDISGTSEASPI